MKNLTTIGRILFALPFGIFGLNHFIMADFYTGMLSTFIPGSSFTILLTGMALIAASISIIIKNIFDYHVYYWLSYCLFLLLLYISPISLKSRNQF